MSKKEYIETLKGDIKSQIDSLEKYGEHSWDVNNKGAWEDILWVIEKIEENTMEEKE